MSTPWCGFALSIRGWRGFSPVVHVDPEEAVRVYKDLVSAHAEAPLPLMLAIHWGTFRRTDEPMDEPPRRAAERHTNDLKETRAGCEPSTIHSAVLEGLLVVCLTLE